MDKIDLPYILSNGCTLNIIYENHYDESNMNYVFNLEIGYVKPNYHRVSSEGYYIASCKKWAANAAEIKADNFQWFLKHYTLDVVESVKNKLISYGHRVELELLNFNE